MAPEPPLSRLTTAAAASIDSRLLVGFVLPLLKQLADLRSDASARPPVLALNGPVGAGKSSLGRVMEALAPAFGLRLVVASIDDVYLPWQQRQQRLAGNPFDVSRVPPGSHDLPLLLESLERWRQNGLLRLPRFDKTLVQGQGDRSGWRQENCDAVVLEGWLMGCQSLGQEALHSALATGNLNNPGAAGAPALNEIELEWLPHWDRELESYSSLWQACDGLWLLRPQNWRLPRRWRFQAEARQRRNGGGWLPAKQLGQMVRASLCSLPAQLYQDPLTADPQMQCQPVSGANKSWSELLSQANQTSQLDQVSAVLAQLLSNQKQGSGPNVLTSQNPRLGFCLSSEQRDAGYGSCLPVQGLATLDSRRRPVMIQLRRDQDSSSESASLIG